MLIAHDGHIGTACPRAPIPQFGLCLARKAALPLQRLVTKVEADFDQLLS